MLPTRQIPILVAVCIALMCASSKTQGGDEWLVTTVDNEGWTTVTASSLAILPNGEPAIGYIHNPGDWCGYDLKYACCDCDVWGLTMVEEFVGSSTSLAILPDGQPAIAYDAVQIKYAWHDEFGWHTTAIDNVVPAGGHVSLVIGSAGNPAISYACGGEPWPDRDLKYAWYDGSAWYTTVVDAVGDVGLYTSLALLPSGDPAISYYDQTNTALKYAWLEGDVWHTVVVDDGGDVGQYSSLAILPSGQPAISYRDATNTALKFAYLEEGGWETVTVDSEDDAGQHTSLAVLPSGHPAISHYDGDEVKFAWYDGSAWRTTSVADAGPWGGRTSLAILPSGQPAISFYLSTPDFEPGASALAYAVRVAPFGGHNCNRLEAKAFVPMP